MTHATSANLPNHSQPPQNVATAVIGRSDECSSDDAASDSFNAALAASDRGRREEWK